MSTNAFPQIDYRINSCLIGINSYRALSGAEEFEQSRLEELTDLIRQADGRCYLRAEGNGQKKELWMVPFSMSDSKMLRLQEAVEQIMECCMGKEYHHFPFDLVADEDCRAYVMAPIDRTRSVPIRRFFPESDAQRWKMAISMFSRVKELRDMGFTSNGISREQLRVRSDNNEVVVWLNETVSKLEGSEKAENVCRHEGFLSIPVLTEQRCVEKNIPISGDKRDVFSAAIVAFYLIMYTHPFVGSAYYSLLRDDYLTRYLYWPEYIMAPGSENNPGNQVLSMVVNNQWNRTVPQLKELFDGIFMAISDPEAHWDENADYWDPDRWITALAADAEQNDNPSSRTDFNFADERYHQV